MPPRKTTDSKTENDPRAEVRANMEFLLRGAQALDILVRFTGIVSRDEARRYLNERFGFDLQIAEELPLPPPPLDITVESDDGGSDYYPWPLPQEGDDEPNYVTTPPQEETDEHPAT